MQKFLVEDSEWRSRIDAYITRIDLDPEIVEYEIKGDKVRHEIKFTFQTVGGATESVLFKRVRPALPAS